MLCLNPIMHERKGDANFTLGRKRKGRYTLQCTIVQIKPKKEMLKITSIENNTYEKFMHFWISFFICINSYNKFCKSKWRPSTFFLTWKKINVMFFFLRKSQVRFSVKMIICFYLIFYFKQFQHFEDVDFYIEN